MQTFRTRKVVPAALLVFAFVGFSAPISQAQSVHREKAQITVGPTVQISKAAANLAHYENLAAGDPEHPGRLITCAMVWPYEAGKLCYQYCYDSFDGGISWSPSLQVTEGRVSGDPTAIYGRGDDVYVVALVIKDLDHPKDPDPTTPQDDAKTVVYKSTDGGRTWKEASRFKFIDREFVDVDTTKGKYAGRIYVVGQTSIRGISGERVGSSLQMFSSLDEGKTFLGPVIAEYPEGTIIAGVGTGAVLSDGTFVVSFGLTKKGRKQNLEPDPDAGPNGELYVISSKDGGETFSKAQKISDWKFDRQRSEGGMLGQLTADPGSAAFKDRLYALYPAVVEDRIQIQLSYSSDKGKTWSKPVTVNDDRSPAKGGKGPDHLLPSIGVNKDGVVLVTWYDRREAKDNLGWKLRAAASLDGGETFSASIPITDAANAFAPTTRWEYRVGAMSDDKASLVTMYLAIDPFFVSGGHTSGLAVDADGAFVPTWIDNRTGISQMWSARLNVGGPAVKHGAADLAGLEDISKYVNLELSAPSFDPASGKLSMTAQLQNIAKGTVEGPVKVRVLTLESELGVPDITNADNGRDGTGAVWDFSAQLAGGPLASMKLSASKTLTFHVSDLRAFEQGKDFKSGLLNIETHVYGKFIKDKTAKDADADKDKAENDTIRDRDKSGKDPDDPDRNER